jgi:hypothetical protein
VTCYVGTAQVGFVACTVMSGIDLGCATAAEIAAASSNDKRKAEDYIERLNAAKSEIAAALVAECGEQLGQLVCVGSALPPGSHCHESAATNTGSGPGGVSCSPAAGEGEVHLSGSITCSKDCYVLTGDATPTPTLPPTPTPTNPPPA